MNDLGEISVQLDTQIKNLGDLDKVTKKMDGLANAVEKAGKAVDVSDKAVKKIADNVAKIDAVTKSISKGNLFSPDSGLNNATEKQVDAFRKVSRAAADVVRSYNRVKESLTGYEKIKKVAEQIERLEGGLKQVSQAMKDGTLHGKGLEKTLDRAATAWVKLRRDIRDTQRVLTANVDSPLMKIFAPEGLGRSQEVLDNLRRSTGNLRKYISDFKKDASSIGKNGLAGDVVFFDTETINKAKDLGQIGAVMYRNGEEVGRFNQIVHRTGDIIDDATLKTNKLTRELLSQGQPLANVIRQFKEFAGSATLLAHNLDFDKSVIEKAGKEVGETFGNRMADTLRLATAVRGQGKGRNTLGTLVKEILGVDNFEAMAHDAANDAEALSRVYGNLIGQAAENLGMSIIEANEKFLAGDLFKESNNKAKAGITAAFDYSAALKEAADKGAKVIKQADFEGIQSNVSRFTSKASAEMQKFRSLMSELDSVGSDVGSIQKLSRIKNELDDLAKGKFGEGLTEAAKHADRLTAALGRLDGIADSPQIAGLRNQYKSLAEQINKSVTPLLTQLGDAQKVAASKFKQANDEINKQKGEISSTSTVAGAASRQLGSSLDGLARQASGAGKAWDIGPKIATALRTATQEMRLAKIGIGDTTKAMENYAKAVDVARQNIQWLLDAERNASGGRSAAAQSELNAITNANKSIVANLERAGRGGGAGGPPGGGGGDGGAGSGPPGGVPLPDPRMLLDLAEATKRANIELARTNNLMAAGAEVSSGAVTSLRTWGATISAMGRLAEDTWVGYERAVRNSAASVEEQAEATKGLNSALGAVGQSVRTVGQLESTVRKLTEPVKELNKSGFQFLDDDTVTRMRLASEASNEFRTRLSEVRGAARGFGDDLNKYKDALSTLNGIQEDTARVASTLQESWAQQSATLSEAQKNTKTYLSEQAKVNASIREQIAIGESAARSHAQIAAAMSRVQSGTQKVHVGMSQVATSITNVAEAARGMLGVLAGFGLLAFAEGLTRTGIAMQQMEATLRSSFDTSDKVAQQLSFLKDVANQLGVAYSNLATPYSRLQIASQQVGFSFQKTQEIFTSLVKTSVALGSSLEEQRGIVKAVEQMISKGNVQYEELKNQLGDRLPGAVSIFARAWAEATGRIERGGALSQKIMKEFSKAMENGLVVSREVLPRVAQLLNETMGKAADEMSNKVRAAFGRLRNTFADTAQELFDSGIEKGLIAISRAAQTALDSGPIKNALLNLTEIFEKMATSVAANILPLSKLALTLGEIVAISLTLTGIGFVSKFFNPMTIAVAGLTVGLINLDSVLAVFGVHSKTVSDFLSDMTNRFYLLINVVSAFYLVFNVPKLTALAAGIGKVIGVIRGVAAAMTSATAAALGFAVATKKVSESLGALVTKNVWGIVIAAIAAAIVYMVTFGRKSTEANEKLSQMADTTASMKAMVDGFDPFSTQTIANMSDAERLSQGIEANITKMSQGQSDINEKMSEFRNTLAESVQLQDRLLKQSSNKEFFDQVKAITDSSGISGLNANRVFSSYAEGLDKSLTTNRIGLDKLRRELLAGGADANKLNAVFGRLNGVFIEADGAADALANSIRSVSGTEAEIAKLASEAERLKKALEIEQDRKTVVDVIRDMADLGLINADKAVEMLNKVNDPTNKNPVGVLPQGAIDSAIEYKERVDAANASLLDVGQSIQSAVDGVGTKAMSTQAKNVQMLTSQYEKLDQAVRTANDAVTVLGNRKSRLEKEIAVTSNVTEKTRKQEELSATNRKLQEAQQFLKDAPGIRGDIGAAIGQQQDLASFKLGQLKEQAAFEKQYNIDYLAALRAQDRAKVESLQIDDKVFKYRQDQERKLKDEAEQGIKNGIGGDTGRIKQEAADRAAAYKEVLLAEEEYKYSLKAQFDVKAQVRDLNVELDASENQLLKTESQRYEAQLRFIGLDEETIRLLVAKKKAIEDNNMAVELYMKYADNQYKAEFELKRVQEARPALIAEIAKLTGQSADSAEVQAKADKILYEAQKDINEQFRERLRLISELEKKKDWESGILRGALKLKEEFDDMAKLGENAITGMFSSWEDAMVEFVTTGKADFSDMIDGFIADITRMYLRKYLFQPVLNMLFPEQGQPQQGVFSGPPWSMFPGGGIGGGLPQNKGIPNPLEAPLTSLQDRMNSGNDEFLNRYKHANQNLTTSMETSASVFSKAGLEAASQLLGMATVIAGMVGGGGGTFQKILAIGTIITSIGGLMMSRPPGGDGVNMGGSGKPGGVRPSYHGGGVVGVGNSYGGRSVSDHVFANAQRYHTGGIVGDEVPIIAKRGEIVATPQQWAAQGASNVTVVIKNESGVNLEASSSTTSAGTDQTMVEVAVRRVFSEDMANRGPMSKQLESRYNVRRSGGGR